MIRFGSIIAWTLIILGGLRAVLALVLALGVSDADNAMVSARYLATANTGEAIDQGLKMLVAGIVIGLLVRIARKHAGEQ